MVSTRKKFTAGLLLSTALTTVVLPQVAPGTVAHSFEDYLSLKDMPREAAAAFSGKDIWVYNRQDPLAVIDETVRMTKRYFIVGHEHDLSLLETGKLAWKYVAPNLKMHNPYEDYIKPMNASVTLYGNECFIHPPADLDFAGSARELLELPFMPETKVPGDQEKLAKTFNRFVFYHEAAHCLGHNESGSDLYALSVLEKTEGRTPELAFAREFLKHDRTIEGVLHGGRHFTARALERGYETPETEAADAALAKKLAQAVKTGAKPYKKMLSKTPEAVAVRAVLNIMLGDGAFRGDEKLEKMARDFNRSVEYFNGLSGGSLFAKHEPKQPVFAAREPTGNNQK